MKTQKNLFETIISLENIELAHKLASKGKQHYREVKWVNANKEVAFRWIHNLLKHKRFVTSPYKVEVAFKGGKERTIHKLPYFPDRIVQHALVHVCKDVWIKSMIRDTFQSIPGRGTLDCFKRVSRFIENNQPKYAMKMDINKFYQSVSSQYIMDNNVLRLGDKDANWLLSKILLSLPNLPLGNHTSQYAGNLLLSPIDWYIKQDLKVKGYFRYCDDLVFFSDSKQELKAVYKLVRNKLSELNLKVKPCEIYNMEEGSC